MIVYAIQELLGASQAHFTHQMFVIQSSILDH